jgi:hypothetical protein
MRRALDEARTQLDALTDRDAILGCYFEHARRLFDFAVLLVVRGDTANGRFVHGLGAPDELVARLSFPLEEPGMLARARDLRRAFIATGAMSDADAILFGSLGRTMPGGLVVPLVVRARVVAIFLGGGAAQLLHRRAHEAGRDPVELAKEEMILWSESVSEALEKLILRRKSGSVPPQRSPSSPPGAPAPIPPILVPRLEDLRADLSLPEPIPATPPFEEFTQLPAAESLPETMASSRRTIALAAGAVAVLGVAAAAAWLTRSDRSIDRVAVAGKHLAGWPDAVDPAALVDEARRVSELGADAELASIQAEVRPNGLVGFGAAGENPETAALTYVFVSKDNEAEVRVDAAGMHEPRKIGRRACSDGPCLEAVPPPHCGFVQIATAARAVGLHENDRPSVTYMANRSSGPAPEWLVSVADRGQARFDASTCAPFPRERLRPPPLPLAEIPGAPAAIDLMQASSIALTQSGLEPDAILLEIDVRGVRGGKLDLSDGESRIIYVLADPPSVPDAKRRWREVELAATGFAATARDGEHARLPSRFAGSVPPPPLCSFETAYRYLTLAAEPTEATARISYGRTDGDSPTGQWRIEIPSAGFRHTASDAECDAWEILKSK